MIPTAPSGYYPRATSVGELPMIAKLLRGFVIGNIWLGLVVGVPILAVTIYMGTTGQLDGKDSGEHSPWFVNLTLLSPFVLGFLLGWLRARPKRISLLAAGFAACPSGIIWLFALAENVNPGIIFVGWIVFIVLMVVAAARFNRFLRWQNPDVQ
jgi:hypothetical protein